MKKFCITFLLSIIIILSAVCFSGATGGAKGETRDYFRIHIRANSNTADDQGVKYSVRDKIVELLTPIAAESNDKEEAMEKMRLSLGAIVAVAEEVLSEKGFPYGARARVEKETFPTRIYGEEELPQGEYDALIVELGSGTGDNWWCVLYPPLCFTSGNQNFRYKSLILEQIEKWKQRKSGR